MKEKNSRKSYKFYISFTIIVFSIVTSALVSSAVLFSVLALNNITIATFLVAFLLILAIYLSTVFANVLTKSINLICQKFKLISENSIDTSVNIKSAIKEVEELKNYSDQIVADIKERKFFQSSFSRQVLVSIFEKYIRDFEKLANDGERKKALIVGVELIGFDEIMKLNTPNEALNIIKDYVNKVLELVYKFGGYIYELSGEKIIAIFYSNDGKDAVYEKKAILSAQRIYYNEYKFYKIAKEKLKKKVDVAVCVLSGEILLIPRGLGDKKDVLTLDFVFNDETDEILKKMFSLLKKRILLVCETTYDSIKERAEVILSDRIRIRNRREPIRIFKLMNYTPDEEVLKERRKFKRVPANIIVNYKPSSSNIEYQNAIVNISGGGLLMKTNQWLGKDLLIDMEFTIPDVGYFKNIKGKIIECRDIDVSSSNPQFEVRVEFVEISDELRDKIKSFVYQE